MKLTHCDRCHEVIGADAFSRITIPRSFVQDKGFEMEEIGNIDCTLTVQGFNGRAWQPLDLCFACLTEAIATFVLERARYA